MQLDYPFTCDECANHIKTYMIISYELNKEVYCYCCEKMVTTYSNIKYAPEFTETFHTYIDMNLCDTCLLLADWKICTLGNEDAFYIHLETDLLDFYRKHRLVETKKQRHKFTLTYTTYVKNKD